MKILLQSARHLGKFLTMAFLSTVGTAYANTNQSSAKTEYTVNGHEIAPEMSMLLTFYGFAAGDYYVDNFGNYGKTGAAPTGNISGGPVSNWSGKEPVGIANNAYAQAYVNGVKGIRVFWVYSPSIFSGATGGSSGYYHICPGNVYYRSSEGGISVGGEYDSTTGHNGPWAGVAGTRQGGGRWTIQNSANGPLLVLTGTDGTHQVLITTLLQGRWKIGQTSYAVEANKASC